MRGGQRPREGRVPVSITFQPDATLFRMALSIWVEETAAPTAISAHESRVQSCKGGGGVQHHGTMVARGEMGSQRGQGSQGKAVEPGGQLLHRCGLAACPCPGSSCAAMGRPAASDLHHAPVSDRVGRVGWSQAASTIGRGGGGDPACSSGPWKGLGGCGRPLCQRPGLRSQTRVCPSLTQSQRAALAGGFQAA